jgi:lactate dehydrogenase-like 2-hydroxyacid dehydrogenase
VLAKCEGLKFICLCATNSNTIDLNECAKRGVTVSNVRDYGDEGVVEWIVMQLLILFRGVGEYQYKGSTSELSGKTIGIFGMGVVGKLLAKASLGLGMNVLYHSKTRNPELEKQCIQFADKSSLIKKSDIISLHTPKNVKILDKSDFELMQGKILVNTTLGKAFDSDDFREWIRHENNYAIMDCVSDFGDEFKDLDRVIYSDIISGKTVESIERLSQKTLDNVVSYISGEPINLVTG